MNRKRNIFLFLTTNIFILSISPSCGDLSSMVDTQTPTSCDCSAHTIPPEINTIVYGTIYAQQTAFPPPTATLPPSPTVTPTRTPHLTSTAWRTEPASTPVSSTYTPLDIFGIDNLPHAIGQLVTPSQEQETDVGERIVSYMKENEIQNLFDGETILVDQIFLVDLDKDGETETVVSYMLANMGAPNDIPEYGLGIAILQDQTVLAVASPEIKGQFPETRLIPIQISSDTIGLLYHVTTKTNGSGIHPSIYREIFVWQDENLKKVWEWVYFGGSRAGAAYRKFSNEKIEFKYLTGQRYADIFLSRQTEELQLTSDNPAHYINYNLQFPGGLVFSWTGLDYQLSHYYDGKALTPIRPVDFIAYAPRIDDSVHTIGDFADYFPPVEYREALGWFGQGIYGRSIEAESFQVAWDDQSLYIRMLVNPLETKSDNTTIWIGVDTDLQIDFDDHVLNKDDYLFKIQIPNSGGCGRNLSAQMIHPYFLPIAFKNKNISQTQSCIVDLGIPFEVIDLADLQSQTSGKILKYENNVLSFPFYQYLPQPGKILGFALFSEDDREIKSQAQGLRQWLHLLPFDPQDPSTWGTLIFMSDR